MITFLAQGLEVAHTTKFIFFRILFPWTGRTHASERVIVHRSGEGFASWALYLTYIEAHQLYTALADGDEIPFDKDGVTITKPWDVPNSREIVSIAPPFACMVPDELVVILLRELPTHLDVVGLPHNIDLETGLDEGARPWRGGQCVCQLPGDPYHAHHDRKPHECADCEACPRWRPAQAEGIKK